MIPPMFCKVPVAYSIGSATLAVVVAAGMKSSTICTVAFSGPVSYTHLDVYKRQVATHNSAFCFSL